MIIILFLAYLNQHTFQQQRNVLLSILDISLLCFKSTIIAVFIIKCGSNGRHLYSKLNNFEVQQRRSNKYCRGWRAAVYHQARLHCTAASYTHCFYSASRGAEGGQVGGGVQCRLRRNRKKRQPPTPPASLALPPCRTGQTFMESADIFVNNFSPMRRRQ